MSTFVITPKVDATQEFIEIANDFSNPLDLVREAISNAYDAKASVIKIGSSPKKLVGKITYNGWFEKNFSIHPYIEIC